MRNEKLYTFLANDFSEPRWRSAALKNAYSLLSKQSYQLAIAFFLLGQDATSAIKVSSQAHTAHAGTCRLARPPPTLRF